jgi:hypothetical protein
MISKQKYLILLLVSIFSLSSNLFSVEKEEIVNVDYRLFVWPYEEFSASTSNKKLPELYWKSGEEYVPMEITLGDVTPWQNYRGTLPLQVFVKWHLQKQDKDVYQPYASVTFPLEAKRVMIFIFSKNKGADGLRQAIAVNASEDFVKPGQCRIINLSPEPIQLLTTEAEKEIGPFGGYFLSASSFPDNRVPIYIKAMKNGKWRRVYSTFYKLNDDSRLLMPVFMSQTAVGTWKMMTVSLK